MAALVGLAVALIWGIGRVLYILGPVLWPLAVAGVLAYLLDPVVDWLQAHRFSRRGAIVAVFFLALCLMGALFASVVPQLVRETKLLAERVPSYLDKAQVKVEEYINNPPGWAAGLLKERWKKALVTPVEPKTNGVERINTPQPTPNPAASSASSTNAWSNLAGNIDRKTLESAGSWIATALPKVWNFLISQLGRVASWFAVLAGLALVPIYAYYLLAEKHGIQSRWTDYLPVSDSKFKDEMVFVLNSANDYMIAFFRGQVLVAICDGIMYTVGFLIIGLPYAVLLGVVSIFLTLIPYLGAIITCSVALLLALVQFGDWTHPALVLVVFAVAQGLEGLVISPRILGDKIGLHPLTIIIALMAGTTLLGGLLGGILAIPLTALLRVVMFRYVWKRPEPAAPGSRPQRK